MKTKTIDGKMYVEYNAAKALKTETLINTLFLVFLFIAIIGLFMAILTVTKNKDMLMSEPINYVMEKYDFVSCSCVNKEGVVFQEGIEIIEVPEVIE